MGFLLLSSGPVALPVRAIAPEAPLAAAYAVTLTAYNAVPEQTDSDPFTTASGAYSNPEVVAARSRDLADKLPFGTIIEIDGPVGPKENCGYGIVAPLIGYRVIADSMNARYTDRVDILFDTKKDYRTSDRGMRNAAEVLGVCDGIIVRVVGSIDLSKPSRLPKTQVELATIVDGAGKNIALK